MINQCRDDNYRILLSLCYDSGKIMQMASEQTQAVANTMLDKEGNDLYEAMSATEDNVWELHYSSDEGWNDVIGFCQAYLYCTPTIPNSDEVTKHYTLLLSLPLMWSSASAVSIDNAIEQYMVCTILKRWWQNKGNADQAAIAEQRRDEARRKIKYGLNSRQPNHSRPVRYI